MAQARQKKYNNPVTATLTGIGDLFRKQVPAGILKPDDTFRGKTVMVDGASSGLGFAIALEVARRGARLIMVCRSGIPEKGEKIRELSGNKDVHMLHVDYRDLSSISELVNKFPQHLSPVDVLICNAGIVPRKSRQTPQGLEEMFMVNYFSKFVLVNMMLSKGLIRTASLIPHPTSLIPHPASRIIFISSESHRNPAQFDWKEFGIYRDYSIGKSIELYGYYKLLLTTFSVELSRRLNPQGQTSCSVFSMCPGPVNSNIAREAPALFQPLLRLVFGIFFRSPEKAAKPAIYLAASADLEGKPFDYLFLMSRKEADEKATDPANGKRLWDLSDALWKKVRN